MDQRQPKNISRFNTFAIFENIYGQEQGSQNGSALWDELESPADKRGSGFFRFLLVIFFIAAFGFSFQPLLAYFLKTPYPLLVIGEDGLAPLLSRNDLIFIRGLVTTASLVPGDLIVFRTENETAEKILAVRQVAANQGDSILLKSAGSDQPISVNISQVIGLVVGRGQPLKIPAVGNLALNR